MRPIKKHLQCENLQIVLVTKGAKALEELLTSEAPSPITYATPKPESVLNEDRQIATFPLLIGEEDVQIVPVMDLFVK